MDPIRKYNLEQQERIDQTIKTMRWVAMWVLLGLMASIAIIWFW